MGASFQHHNEDIVPYSHFQEQLRPVHHLQNKEDEDTIAQCEQHRVPRFNILFSAIKQRIGNATEVHNLPNEICRYGVAAETEQPPPSFGVALDINPPIEKRK